MPYFARHGFRVLVFDGRGNGRSGRPATGYRTDDFVQDTLSVLDAVGIKTAVLVGISDGAKWGIQMAAEHPGRVSDLVLIGPSARLSGSQRKDLQSFFSEPVDRDGWNKYNAVYWQRDYRGFLEFFCSQVISQPHSTKQIEDQIKWGLETTPEVLIATEVEGATPQMAEFVANVRCPVLILHGTNDAIIPSSVGEALHAAIPQSVMKYIEGGSHGLPGREPVKLIQHFDPQCQMDTETLRTRLGIEKDQRVVVASVGGNESATPSCNASSTVIRKHDAAYPLCG